jgi:glycosyltransferase involved in cell wall biosynthesis
MAILEAMAQGKPILTSDFPPMLEAIDDRVTGYVTRRGDPESVAEAVRCFSRLGPGLEEMSRAAFRKVQECFSADRIADEYLADFRSLILQRTLIRQGH